MRIYYITDSNPILEGELPDSDLMYDFPDLVLYFTLSSCMPAFLLTFIILVPTEINQLIIAKNAY